MASIRTTTSKGQRYTGLEGLHALSMPQQNRVARGTVRKHYLKPMVYLSSLQTHCFSDLELLPWTLPRKNIAHRPFPAPQSHSALAREHRSPLV